MSRSNMKNILTQALGSKHPPIRCCFRSGCWLTSALKGEQLVISGKKLCRVVLGRNMSVSTLLRDRRLHCVFLLMWVRVGIDWQNNEFTALYYEQVGQTDWPIKIQTTLAKSFDLQSRLLEEGLSQKEPSSLLRATDTNSPTHMYMVFTSVKWSSSGSSRCSVGCRINSICRRYRCFQESLGSSLLPDN